MPTAIINIYSYGIWYFDREKSKVISAVNVSQVNWAKALLLFDEMTLFNP